MFVAPGNAHMERKTQEQLYLLFILGCVGYFLLTYLVRPLFDPDFFWHLKSGEIIFNTGCLPDSDLFSIDGTTRPDMRQQFLLTSYWASQLLYYVLYYFFDYSGIIILRIVIALALIYCIYQRCSGDKWLIGAVLLIFMQLFLQLYPLERPQVFSFLFFSVLLLLIDRCLASEQRGNIEKFAIFIFLTMFIWANFHGGYVIGLIVLIYYSVYILLDIFIIKKNDLHKNIKLLLVFIFGVFFSFLNPNYYNVIKVVLGSFGYKSYYSELGEYEPFLANIFTAVHINRVYSVFFIICVIIVILRSRFRGRSDSVLCLFFLIAGFSQSRYVAFFFDQCNSTCNAGSS